MNIPKIAERIGWFIIAAAGAVAIAMAVVATR